MNALSLFLFTVGIILLTIGIIENSPIEPVVIYKEKPKESQSELYDKQFETSLNKYSGLFNTNDPWLMYPFKYNYQDVPNFLQNILNIPRNELLDRHL